jgi:glycosyltransferase involved in cell wall biosynthesis
MKKLKVLHVVNISFVLPYFIGDQFTYFKDRGLDIHVACTPSKHLFDYSKEKKFIPFGVNVLREINIIEDICSIYKISKYIKENKIDVVIGHTPKGGLISMIAAFVCKLDKRIYFRHGIMFETSKGLKRSVLVGLEKLAGYLSTQVVCVSQSVIDVSNRLRLSDKKKNILLGNGTCNGIDIDFFSKQRVKTETVNYIRNKYGIKSSDSVIGYVGRLVNDKGINELIEAWKLIINEFDDIKLLLVGPFEERDGLSLEVREFITKHPSIIHTGLIIEVREFYNIMDVFILPSYREGFPTVVLEASAMELPVITTKATGCIDSIINNKTGIFTSLDSLSILSCVSKYMNNPGLAREHGQNGRAFVVNNFDRKIIWKDIEMMLLN